MTVHPIQVTGTRGEVSPLMHARIDTDFYQSAYAKARNVIVTRFGPTTRAPGSVFDGLAKFASRKSRMLKFEFSATQVYAIEAGHEYFRFWTPSGQVVSGGVPYEIATPYQEADLRHINFAQSGDVLYIWCRGYRPRILTRLGETNWTLTQYAPLDGPYMSNPNRKGTKLTPASTGHLTPQMSGATTPAGEVTSSEGSNAWQMFDRVRTATVALAAGSSGWFQYQVAGAARVADAYWLTAPDGSPEDMFTAWEFQGSSNGTDFVTLDSRVGEAGWGASETRYYEFVNETAYEYYRLTFRGGGGPNAADTRAAELAIHERAEDQTPFNLTASSTDGINNDTGFQPGDVGRFIRLRGSDGRWRAARIAARISTTVVTIQLYGHALPDTSPIGDWALGVWSDTSGWPETGTFYDDRLVMANWPGDPIGVAFSVNGAYDNFRVSTPGVTDDGIILRLTGGGLDPVQWLAENGALLVGTGGKLRSVDRRDAGTALASTNVRQRGETTVAASDVFPIEVENVTLFIDSSNGRLYETAFSYEADGFVAREVSTLNSHLFIGIEQIVYVGSPHKMILCRRGDGKIVAFAYDREQKVAGGTLLDYRGVVEDIAAVPSLGPDPDVWLTVQRPGPFGPQRHIERLFWGDLLEGGVTVQVYAAGAYRKASGGPVSSLNLPWLSDQLVGVLLDGRDVGTHRVEGDGTLDLPYEASAIVVGLRMPWRLETLRLSQIGNQDGTGLGRKVKVLNGRVDLLRSAGVSVGTLKQVDRLRWDGDTEVDLDEPEPLVTGMFKMPVDGSYDDGGVFVVEGDTMYPATIRAIALEVVGEP